MDWGWHLKIFNSVAWGLIAAMASSAGAQEIRALDEADQHFQKAVLLKQESQFAQSEAEFRVSIRLNPQAPEAYNDLGAVLRLEGRTDEAISNFEHAIQLRASFSGARFNLALAFAARHRLSEAEAELRRALEYDASCGECWYELGILADLQKKPQLAVERLSDAIAVNPNSADSYYALSHALLEVNQPTGSERALLQAIQLRPGFAAAHQELALALERQQKFSDALKEFQSAAISKPELTQALLGQARMKAALGDITGARVLFANCLAKHPHDAMARVQFAAFLRQQGQTQAAIMQAQKAAHLTPNLASAYYELGMALKEAGARPAAESALRHALRIDPSDEQSHAALAALLRVDGETAAARAEFASARGILQRQSDRDQAALANKLGVSLAQGQNWKDAIAQFRRALALKPDLAAARFNLAGALRESGELETAIDEFKQILREHPDWIQARFEFGRTLQLRGLIAEAGNQYRRIVRDDPDFTPAQEALAMLGVRSSMATAGNTH